LNPFKSLLLLDVFVIVNSSGEKRDIMIEAANKWLQTPREKNRNVDNFNHPF
jgi:hypothetical protein